MENEQIVEQLRLHLNLDENIDSINFEQAIIDEGDDVINGGAGQDQILGGIGNDSIDAGDDDDIVAGEEGDDIINGGAGANVNLNKGSIDKEWRQAA